MVLPGLIDDSSWLQHQVDILLISDHPVRGGHCQKKGEIMYAIETKL
jgi:hypothetical protein